MFVRAPVKISFYHNTPAPANLIGTVTTSIDLNPGEYEDVTIVWTGFSVALYTIYAVADDDGTGTGSVSECMEDNNECHFESWICAPTTTPTMTPTPTSTPTPPPTAFCCWEPPDNAGASLNSTAKDWHPGLASDEETLFFASARPGGQGKSDIWISLRIGPGVTEWSAPVNLGRKINTSQLEAAPSISYDMQELFFEAYNLGNSSIDIFISTWDISLAEWKTRKPLSSTINTAAHDERHPFISRESNKLYFDTDRPGGPGNFDIWVTERYRGRWFSSSPVRSRWDHPRENQDVQALTGLCMK